MFVLKHHDPTRCQINQEWRTYDDVAKTLPGGYIVCTSPNLALKLQSSGFQGVIDDKGVLVSGSPSLDKSDASDILGVPVPVVNKWINDGTLKAWGERLCREDVEALAEQRGD